MKNILKNYRRRLLNLGSGNRTLLLLRLFKESYLDLESLDFLGGEPAFEIINKLISGKKRINICPYVDSRHAPVTSASRGLHFIKRKAEIIFQERGSRELYVGWPFVHGKFLDGTIVRCPLLFFPVELQVNSKQQWELLPNISQQPQFNQSFLLAYAHYMGTALAEELTELDLSTLSQHPVAFRTSIYELLKEHQLVINAGRDLFSDKLKPFRNYKKADYEEQLQTGQLYLEQEAVLGIFPQAGSYLLADYDMLLQNEDLKEMEDLFKKPDRKSNSSIQSQQTFTAFAMDASQEVALQAVKKGNSLVVQGPPGTGKSQLICNLVSDFTARGKKVLVVSQKRAALDVVHQRLSSQGMGKFAALIHDINTDRKPVFAQLQHQIEHIDQYKQQNLALNSIYTDRVFLETSRGINYCLDKLEEFKLALFDTNVCGWSAKELYLKSSLNKPYIKLPNGFKKITSESIPDLLPRIKQYLKQVIAFDHERFSWSDRRSMQGYSWLQRQELERIIQDLPSEFEKYQEAISSYSGFNFSLDKLEDYRKAAKIISSTQDTLKQKKVEEIVQTILQRKVNANELYECLQLLRQLYLVCPAPDAAINSTETDKVEQAIEKFEVQGQNIFKRVQWHFSKEKEILKQALSKYKLDLDEAGVGELQRRLTLRQQAVELMNAINSLLSFEALTIKSYPTQVLEQLKIIEQALDVSEHLRQLHRNELLNEEILPDQLTADYLKKLSNNIDQLSDKYTEWTKWLTESQVQRLIQDEGHRLILLEELPNYFEKLVAFDTLKDSLKREELVLAQSLINEGIKNEEEGEALFLNSLYLAWLHELESLYPALRMPSNGGIAQLEIDLQKHLKEKQQISQEIVLARLGEQTYKDIELNRLGNMVTYRRLHAQVSKKRSLYPLRKLFSLFSDEILNLIPCWLASPETVSAVFPLEACFDLVIFDEASQCFSETGIPAMFRGQQVVVAGDQQQLKPSDLYRTRWSSEEDSELEELSAESLLQLCSMYLPQTMLTQHYRSHYPELIDFSNRYFYDQKLELIPELADANERQPAIQFVKVHGLWKNNTNVPEAEKVVDTVLELLQTGQEDIGVITFNFGQQMLVQDLLMERAQEQSILIPATILVKNIENIQGDEKEVIILSVGYAPDEQGKLTMQFGSLNQAGGENRLNVAITRARQQMIIISSIRAEQLQVENTMHIGPKLLKDYLHYAQQVSRRYFKYEPKQTVLPMQVPLLKIRLEELFADLKQEVPFADLTVVHDNFYKGVVLTDDDLYYSQPSVRYSHADLPGLLQTRNWPYQRIYSRQLWESKSIVAEELRPVLLEKFDS